MLIKNSLFLNGKKNLIFSGEVHFWRINPKYWEKCLKSLKAAGINIVSTYVSWRRHSVSPFENDLTGKTDARLDLSAFLNLCKRTGLWVHLKPGPWICAEEENGGYPDWLINDNEILVRDNKGQMVIGYNPPHNSYFPSYLHPRYLEYVKKWLTDIDLLIRDLCYPKGSIVLIQLDNEPSMTFHDKMFESDYNSINIKNNGFYQKWLQEKYKSIKYLNNAYKMNYNSFIDVKAPVNLDINHLYELQKYNDWVDFKEWLIAKHVETLRKIHIKNGIKGILFTVNFNQHTPMSVPNNWKRLEQAAKGIAGYDYYATPPLVKKNIVDFIKAINYSLAVLKVPWAPEMMCGIWKLDNGEKIFTNRDQLIRQVRMMSLLGLAYGLKGLNFYMFCSRENWEHAPVSEKGQITHMRDIPEKVLNLVKSIKDFNSLKKDQKVAVMYYRPYAWESFISENKDIKIDSSRLGHAYYLFETIYDVLANLNYDPAIFDPFINKKINMNKYKIIFIPSSIYMDKSTQKLIEGYVEKGGIAVFLSEIPSLDGAFKPYLHFKTHAKYAKNSVQEELDIKEFLIEKGKIIKIGSIYFNDSGKKNKQKIVNIFDSLLMKFRLRPPVETDDSHVLTVVQKNVYEEILFLINTDTRTKEVRLKFSEHGKGMLQDVFSRKVSLHIKNSECIISIDRLSVKVFRIVN